MYLNQAVLGEAGAVGADGFPLPSDCRALTIYGDAGQVLKRAVSANTAQAAGHTSARTDINLRAPGSTALRQFAPKHRGRRRAFS